MRLKFLLEKEFKQMFRNPLLPRMILAMPLMTMLLLPWAATMEIRNLTVTIVDNDKTPLSRRLSDKIDASKYFDVVSYRATYPDALKDVESGLADVIVEIPQRFARDITSTGSSNVFIAPNAVNGMQGSLSGQYMTATVVGFASELRDESGVAQQQLLIEPRYLFNPYLDSKTYMIPALMVMLITMLCGFVPTLNIVSEKEKGTIEQLNVSPVGKGEFILAKVIPVWIIGFVVLSIGMLLSATLYGLSPVGSVWTIYGASAILAAGFAGAGLLLSIYSATMQQSMFMMFFFMIIFMLTSGLFTPINSMPTVAREMTIINPLKYLIEVLRMVYLKGSTVAELWRQFVALGVFAVVFNVWAIMAYRKRS